MKHLLLFVLVLFVANSFGIEVPKLTRFATDQTATIPSAELNQLEGRLKTFSDTTSNQLVVLMIATLDGNALEEYSYEVASKNAIGQKKVDNGVLLLVVKNDRKTRIEVGYGLEGVLPDALTSSIIRREMIPYFKQGDFSGGITAGVNAIIAGIGGEYKAKPKKDEGEGGSSVFGTIIFIIVILLSLFSRGGRGGRGGGLMTGLLLGSMLSGGGRSSWGGGGGGFGGFSGGGGSFGGGGSSGSW